MTRYRFAADGRMVPMLPGPAHLQPHRRFRSTARWQRMRAAQKARQPWCSACGHRGSADNPLTVDHVVPVILGGAKFAESNLRTLCRSCNSRKGAG
jgi:5-methylcytosine-specific restriction endonuclease McrA